MAQLKDLLVIGDSRIIGNSYNNTPKIAFGTCATAAATAEKVVTIDNPAWNLQVGDIIGVKFTNSNTASTVKLNVNGTGAIQLAYNTTRPFTGADNWITGYANRTIFYQYDGTYWYWITAGYNQNGDTYTTAKSWTGAGTAAKTATCHDYAAQANSWIMVQMVYANTSASALTLNINSQGAKPIYINGSASSSSNYTLPKAHYLVYYDGTNYYFRTDGKITGSITGNAETVNGKTVGVNVPTDAKFTDTTYTFGTGDSTGQIKITPSNGSAQNITIKDLEGPVYGIITITKPLLVGTEWMDTGIVGADLGSTGSFIVQLTGANSGQGGLWGEMFTGITTNYAGGTNSGETDEILLQNTGHAPNGGDLFLRWIRTGRTQDGNIKLQIASYKAFTKEQNMIFKFRKMI